MFELLKCGFQRGAETFVEITHFLIVPYRHGVHLLEIRRQPPPPTEATPFSRTQQHCLKLFLHSCDLLVLKVYISWSCHEMEVCVQVLTIHWMFVCDGYDWKRSWLLSADSEASHTQPFTTLWLVLFVYIHIMPQNYRKLASLSWSF